jgi:hypothetical protein
LTRAVGLLAFGIGVAVWPGITGFALVVRWGLFGIGIAAMMFRPLTPHPMHRMLLLTLAWAAFSILWQPVWAEGLNGLIQLSFFVAAIAIGLELKADAGRPLMIGLGIAITVSMVIGIIQFRHPMDIPAVNIPAGLFVNRIMFGEAAAVALVGALALRLWVLVPSAFVSVAIAQCRGAYLACAVCGILWLWPRSRLGAVACALGLVFGVSLSIAFMEHGPLSLERLYVWHDAIDGFDFIGNGIGSFYTMSPAYGGHTALLNVREAHAHNDLLEIVFELGAGSIFLVTVFIVALSVQSPLRWPLIVIVVEGTVGFPLHSPLTAFVGAVLAGMLCADRARICDALALCGKRDGYGDRFAPAALSHQLCHDAPRGGDLSAGLHIAGGSRPFGRGPEWNPAAATYSQGSG